MIVIFLFAKRKLLPVGKRKIYLFLVRQSGYLYNVNTIECSHLVDAVSHIFDFLDIAGKPTNKFRITIPNFELVAMARFVNLRNSMSNSHIDIVVRIHLIKPSGIEFSDYPFKDVIGLPVKFSLKIDYILLTHFQIGRFGATTITHCATIVTNYFCHFFLLAQLRIQCCLFANDETEYYCSSSIILAYFT